MPANQVVTRRFYPALSEVITVDDLPEFLHFAENGLNLLLDKIHYKNLQYSKSQRGDSAFYSLDIVTSNIGLDLPFGLRLVLNPDEDGDSNISSFPISIQYQWEMLAFLRSFKVQNFAFTPEAFYELGLQIFKITEDEVIAHILNYFVEDNDTETKFEQLLDAVNVVYGTNLSLPPDEEPTVDAVVALINNEVNIPKSVSAVMFGIYILDTGENETRERLQQFYNRLVPNGIEDYIKQLITPKLKATLKLSAGIEFPRNILKPVNENGALIDGEPTSMFTFGEATFYADTESGIGADVELAGNLVPEYAQIGNTNLFIGIKKAKLDLSKKRNIAEADAAGYGPDFTGLYIERATIGLSRFGKQSTTKTSVALIGEDMLIGTGGVSGKISLESNGALYHDFGLFEAELNLFSVTFKKGAIVESDIAGKLTIPGFKDTTGQQAIIDIRVHIQDNGDFELTAKPQQGLLPITLPNVFTLNIRSFNLGKEARGFYIQIAGTLDFIADIPGLGQVLPKDIEIQKLRIWDDGEIEFDGGSFVIQKAFKLKVGPVNLEVSQIAFGAYTRQLKGIERKYRFFGFDGMINTGNAGVNATGNGIKYYFTIDHNDTDKSFDSFTSIDGIGIDLTIPGNVSKEKAAFILNGYLSMSNPDPAIRDSKAGSEYTGSISFSMPKLRLSGSAAMTLTPSVPSFVVDIGMELPGPIPLGATGLGIYGFRGIIGRHYIASKSATKPPLPDTASWWEYYKAKSNTTGREGIELDKFADKAGYSVGAGVSIATSFDNGFTFSTKLFLYLGLPNLFLLQGQAGVLRSRIGLNKDVDPPFSALIAIDDKSFISSLGVNYRLPEGGAFDGAIFSLSGKLELAFFFNNASGWYLNVGKDQPESERIRARILTLFQGYAYLMISSRGIKAGAGARFDFKANFGIVEFGFGAFVDLGGSISFKPIQIGGYIRMGGYAYIRILRFKFYISITVTLGFEAPNPFNIYGALELDLGLPWPVRKLGRIKITLSWKFNNNREPLFDPIQILSLPDPATGYMPAAATNMLSSETFPINYVNYEITGSSVNIPAPGAGGWQYNFNDENALTHVTIPLDSFIDIDLLKPVKPVAGLIGGAGNQLPDGYIEMLPPQKGISSQVRHELQLLGLEIYAWNENGSWQPYNIYEAVTVIRADNTGTGAIDLSKLNNAYWQFNEPNRYNKIRVLSQNMFSYSNGMSNSTANLDALNFQRKDLFCYENVSKLNVVNWIGQPLNKVYQPAETFYIKNVAFRFTNIEGQVQNDAGFGNTVLQLAQSGGSLSVILPEAVTTVSLDFGANANALRVDYVQHQYRIGYDINPLKYMGHNFGDILVPKTVKYNVQVLTQYLGDTESNTSLNYNNLNQPINEVMIHFESRYPLNFEGDIVLGGYFNLPASYISTTAFPNGHEFDAGKALVYATIYNKAFTATEVLIKAYNNPVGVVGQWPLDNRVPIVGNQNALVAGNPGMINGFYGKTSSNEWQLHQAYDYTANSDALLIPFEPELKVEEGNFAFEVTAVFNPFEAGVSTLFSRVTQDPTTGKKKGYALHLYQDAPGNADTIYGAEQPVPSFKIWFTAYQDLGHYGLSASEKYTLNCDTGKLTEKQYKQILISVNRSAGTIDIFIDKVLKASEAIPSELDFVAPVIKITNLNQLSYLTEVLQRRLEENNITPTGFIDEAELLSNNLNKTIQPVWRPDTTYAIVVKTRDVIRDVIEENAEEEEENADAAVQKNHIYGFKTVGPIGHFQKKNAIYKALKEQDKAAAFKLADLKHYIDYERSFPDAQSRYDLSKPVFCHDPKVSLLFVKPYLNAMFSDWDGYLGLPTVKSTLQLQLLDPYGAILSPELIWEQLPDEEITNANFMKLPPDQQLLYFMNRAALEDSCNVNPVSIKKRKKQGAYHFPNLEPNRLYTALFTAVYQPLGEVEQRAEIHRFNFKTSRFSTFAEQAGSYVLNSTTGSEKYAVYPLKVSFTQAEIDGTIKKLIDDNLENDAAEVIRYAAKYDRLVYGGLTIKNLEPIETTVIHPVINIDPLDSGKRLLGILIRNPEPFNNPKLPLDSLNNTVGLSLSPSGQAVLAPEAFIYIHAQDTSAVFISNAGLNMPVGDTQLHFKYKIFNGNDYETDSESYNGPIIRITL
ncbi:hypothetical protein [Pedobacter alluvionis]|uniref:Uncharacterized protein n=1 Tax=Pedobacter alluvionis TaxID=475253 RepID=A0A497YKD7_9SPHI|nr:hypothetical protein [Pedobacter alluvionis]RLJ80520.1 hypothetical protein BCL90_1302 [Pedobacter alluvionis]TFB31790.1 hypothetical protein E3V97_14515 [Pedobacter alluvionis]